MHCVKIVRIFWSVFSSNARKTPNTETFRAVLSAKCIKLASGKAFATDTVQNSVEIYPGVLMDENNFQLLFSAPVKLQQAQAHLDWSHIPYN